MCPKLRQAHSAQSWLEDSTLSPIHINLDSSVRKMVTPRHSGVYQSVPVDESSRETPSTSPAPQDLRLLFKTLAACLSWLVCSSTIILVNKYIMVSRLSRWHSSPNSTVCSSLRDSDGHYAQVQRCHFHHACLCCEESALLIRLHTYGLANRLLCNQPSRAMHILMGGLAAYSPCLVKSRGKTKRKP